MGATVRSYASCRVFAAWFGSGARGSGGSDAALGAEAAAAFGELTLAGGLKELKAQVPDACSTSSARPAFSPP
jgi:hypothetical protein